MKYLLAIAFLLLLFCRQMAAVPQTVYLIDNTGTILDSAVVADDKLNLQDISEGRPNPVLQLLKKRQQKNKKIVAAALAFPFPFGIVGLHRIYLGTAPHVPVVYIGSLGGIFGVLPFIDFCVILLDKDFERYNNNSKIFMWVN